MNDTIMLTMLRSLISLLPIDPDAVTAMIIEAYNRVVTWDERLKAIEVQLQLREVQSQIEDNSVDARQ